MQLQLQIPCSAMSKLRLYMVLVPSSSLLLAWVWLGSSGAISSVLLVSSASNFMRKVTYIKVLIASMPLLYSAFFVTPVFADTLASNQGTDSFTSPDTAEFTGGPLWIYQDLGTGLTGSLSNITLLLNMTTTYSGSLSVDIRTGSCGGTSVKSFTTASSTYAAGANFVTLTVIGSPLSLSSGTHYYLSYQLLSPLQGGVYGSDSNTYPGGNIGFCNGTNNFLTNGVVDSFFILSGAATTVGANIYNFQPGMSSTTASSNVSFSFTYDLSAALNYSSYYVNMDDLGLYTSSGGSVGPGQVTQYTGSVTGGVGNVVSRVLALNTGHEYAYTVQLCGSLVLINPCYTSATYYFLAGGSLAGLTPITPQFQPFNVSTSSPTSTVPFSAFFVGTSTGLSSPSDSVLDPYASCSGLADVLSLGLCPLALYLFVPSASSFNGFDSIQSSLASHLPFAYFYEVLDDFDVVSNPADASSTLSTVINFSAMSCTGAWQGTGALSCDPNLKNWMPSTLTLFSTTSMATVLPDTWIFYLKSAAEIAMGFAFGIYWFNRLKGFFNSPATV